jgi:hypothetical protein
MLVFELEEPDFETALAESKAHIEKVMAHASQRPGVPEARNGPG